MVLDLRSHTVHHWWFSLNIRMRITSPIHTITRFREVPIQNYSAASLNDFTGDVFPLDSVRVTLRVTLVARVG